MLQRQSGLYEIGHSYSVITAPGRPALAGRPGGVPVIHTLRDAALVEPVAWMAGKGPAMTDEERAENKYLTRWNDKLLPSPTPDTR